MGRSLNRTAAFTALGRALTAGARGGPSLGARLAALPRMVWATITRRYDGGSRLAMMLVATAYVASPIDLVPEAFLLLVGLIDDAVVIAWLAGAILSETERFIEWDARQRSVVPGHVV
ncbi:YkvA family protein [Phytohabitans suffuscus]|uniref:YkvA family protein n=1 Tax=Phytohabitans suffuscus TaxID=624315 RepID=UPI001563392D|nr:YkvA family protein [Phytohabitans suffuscus]